MRDPLRRLPTPLRLWAALALCVAPMGLVWSTHVTTGITLYGDCGAGGGPYCTPDQYLPGSVNGTLVSQSPIRVFLALAIAVFAVCALRPRTSATRTAARLACAGLVVAVAIAAGNGASAVVLCLIGALLLVGPLVASRTPSAGVLA
jgi:hypothetical protein